jgi:hypothetical protein
MLAMRRYQVDFTNFAAVEFVGAIEAQRALDRRDRKWLVLWRELSHAADEKAKADALATLLTSA